MKSNLKPITQIYRVRATLQSWGNVIVRNDRYNRIFRQQNKNDNNHKFYQKPLDAGNDDY